MSTYAVYMSTSYQHLDVFQLVTIALLSSLPTGSIELMTVEILACNI